jgi:hypothetical protein
MRSFFSNAAYATWIQSVILVITVVVALLTIRANHHENSVNNTNQVLQRYYTGSPTLFSYTNDLVSAQWSVVQNAKHKIPNYDSEQDRDFVKLFEVAHPLVLEKFEKEPILRQKYEALQPFFVATVLCVDAEACDQPSTVALLGEDIRRFYNAVCAYQGKDKASASDTQHLISFLVNAAHFTDLYHDYFCPEQVEPLLNPH